MKTNFLRETLANESRSYGFTIAFWGSGSVLVKAQGLPTIHEALLYGLGAVIGFGLLTLLVYRSPLTPAAYQESDILVLSMIHYGSALIPIISAFYLTRLGPGIAFFATGLAVSIFYNLGIVIEEAVAEQAEVLEQWLRHSI